MASFLLSVRDRPSIARNAALTQPSRALRQSSASIPPRCQSPRQRAYRCRLRLPIHHRPGTAEASAQATPACLWACRRYAVRDAVDWFRQRNGGNVCHPSRFPFKALIFVTITDPCSGQALIAFGRASFGLLACTSTATLQPLTSQCTRKSAISAPIGVSPALAGLLSQLSVFFDWFRTLNNCLLYSVALAVRFNFGCNLHDRAKFCKFLSS